MKKARFVVVFAILAMVLAVPALAASRLLTSDLHAANEVPPATSDASGVVNVLLDPAKGQICVHIKSIDLVGDVIAGHIHEAPAGVNGPIVVNLEVDSATFKNCVAAEPDLIRAIGSNPSAYYVNVHTTVFPGGELRGQLTR